jgi:hypothetical protein
MLKDMNPTRWTFEVVSAELAEERRAEETKVLFDVVKSSLIQLLGLNLMPVQDGERLRFPEDNEIIPLTVWTAQEPILNKAMELNKELLEQGKVEQQIEKTPELSPEDLDALFEQDGDIDFTDAFAHPDWDSDEAKILRKQLIRTIEATVPAKPLVIETDSEEVPEFRKSSKVVIESE